MFFAPSKSRQRTKIQNMDIAKASDHIHFKIPRYQTSVRNLQHSPKPQIRTQKTWIFFAPSTQGQRAKIGNMGVSQTRNYFQIKMPPNPSQKHPVSSKAPNHDLKDNDILCPIQIKIESKLWNMGISKTNEHIQIRIRMIRQSQEPPASSKAINTSIFCGRQN